MRKKKESTNLDAIQRLEMMSRLKHLIKTIVKSLNIKNTQRLEALVREQAEKMKY